MRLDVGTWPNPSGSEGPPLVPSSTSRFGPRLSACCATDGERRAAASTPAPPRLNVLREIICAPPSIAELRRLLLGVALRLVVVRGGPGQCGDRRHPRCAGCHRHRMASSSSQYLFFESLMHQTGMTKEPALRPALSSAR